MTRRSSAPKHVLLPALDAWRTGGAAPSCRKPSLGRSIGCSLNIERTAASPSSTPRPDATMRPVSSWLADTFSRMDAVSAKRAVSAITTAITDALYEGVAGTDHDAEGNVIGGERRTSVNHAMKTCRRAWNVVARCHPGKLSTSTRRADGLALIGTRDADRDLEELQAYRAKAVGMGPAVARDWRPDRLGVVATPGRIFSELRPSRVLGRRVPDMVHMVHQERGEENTVPLFDDNGRGAFSRIDGQLDATCARASAG